jgi:ArsR family transcriptional regulator
MEVNQNMSSCSEKLKILSNPQRLKILELLSTQSLNVTAINQEIDIPQNLLSYHLKVLEENEFIVSEKSGKNVFYTKSENLKLENKKLKLNLKCCELNF